MLFLIKKHRDSLIERTKTKPQETLELQINKQMETFSFNRPINLVEDVKKLLGVSSFEAMKSVININNENKSFSITSPRYWSSRGGAENILKLQKLLEIRPQNDIVLHLEKVR